MSDDVLDPLLTTPRPPFNAEPFAPHKSQNPIRVSSQLLLATKSPVLLEKFKPTYQFRILRRKKLLQNGLPMGIRFVVDLSPPVEGDDAVMMQEVMYVPADVRDWENKDVKFVRWEEPDCGEVVVAPDPESTTESHVWSVEEELQSFRKKTWGVSREIGTLVGPPSLRDPEETQVTNVDLHLETLKERRDGLVRRYYDFEFSTSGGNAKFIDPAERKARRDGLWKEIIDIKQEINDYEIQKHGKGSELGCLECENCAISKPKPLPSPLKVGPETTRTEAPLEYSLSRHVSALERIIALITHNLDPHLHSATMWYTFFLAARNLKLLHVPAIVDTVLGWFYRPGNIGFVEQRTELCFHIANELRAPILLRECFALSVARGPPFQENNPYHSAFVAARHSYLSRHIEVWDKIMSLDWITDGSIIPQQEALSSIINGDYPEDIVEAAVNCRKIIEAVVKCTLEGAVKVIWNTVQPNAPTNDTPARNKIQTNRWMWERLATIEVRWDTHIRRNALQSIGIADELDWFHILRSRALFKINCAPKRQCPFDQQQDLPEIPQEPSSGSPETQTTLTRFAGYLPPPTLRDGEASFTRFLSTEAGVFGYSKIDPETAFIALSKLLPLSKPPSTWPPPLPDRSITITPSYSGQTTAVTFTHPVSALTILPETIFTLYQDHIRNLANQVLSASGKSEYDGQWGNDQLLGGLTEEEWKLLPPWASSDESQAAAARTLRVGEAHPAGKTHKDCDDQQAWSVQGEGRTEVPDSEKSWVQVGSESSSNEFGVMSDDGLSSVGFGSEAASVVDGEMSDGWKREGMVVIMDVGGGEGGGGEEDETMTEVGSESDVADFHKDSEVVNPMVNGTKKEVGVTEKKKADIDDDIMGWDSEEEWDDSNFE